MHLALRSRLLSLVAVLSAVAGLVVAAAHAAPVGPPGGIEAEFADARAKDDVRGVLTQTDTGARVLLSVPAGSVLSARLTPDASLTEAATGLALVLAGPDGEEIPVAGTGADRTKPGTDAVVWKKVPADVYGEYALVVTAATPGGFRLMLTAKDARTTFRTESAEGDDLAVGATARVPFVGRAGDLVAFALRPGRKSKFVGKAVRLVRPDGSTIQFDDGGAKGKLVLDADGDHELEFTNAGRLGGAWRAALTVNPRKVKKRRGFVSAVQTGLVPKVKSVTPSKGVHLDTTLEITLTGADFQPGMDVRLEKKGRQPIVATDVVVISPTETSCVVDLDTRDRDAGVSSVGAWRVAVRNAPLYGDAADPATLVTDTPLVDTSRSLTSVSSGSVRLPKGVEAATEVWHVAFTSDFDDDLDHMGLSSSDPATRRATRNFVEEYVVAYLRDLFGPNETNGNVKGAAVPVSFVLDDVTGLAGQAGETYDQVRIGGAPDQADPVDAAEPLPWGFAPFDDGNATRDVVSVRTAVLDPRGGNPDASSSWRLAMQPLRDTPLGSIDVAFLTGRFDPNQPAQVARYAQIVEQIERAAREIAALAAHQIGKAMGLPTAGTGPMDAPTSSGAMWVARTSLAFASGDLVTLRTNAVPHTLPGKSDPLIVAFLPIVDRQPELLPNLTTGQPYSASWNCVGGRCNAVPADYRFTFTRGSAILLGLSVTYDTLAGTAPVLIDPAGTSIASVYGGVASFLMRVDDTVRGGGSALFHRLKIVPDINQFPPGHPLRTGVQSLINQVLSAP